MSARKGRGRGRRRRRRKGRRRRWGELLITAVKESLV